MLADKKCVPCELGGAVLPPAEVQKLLLETPGWELALEGRAIRRRFGFKNFKTAMAFTNAIGDIAEEQGHHPDLLVGWGYAQVVLWTHAIGGLHENDFIMASKINALAQ